MISNRSTTKKSDIMIKAVRTNLFLFFYITISTFQLKGNDMTIAYIEQYKTIVVNEMSRTGIPASIKMAQAILESGSGRSTLARQSNNHFGIKCGKNWKGKEVYRHDDDYKDGLLVRSCFRAYDSPEESFMAHSDFLANPYSKRYKFLFDLDRFDYKSWALGLRKAGYATDPNYPKKLINIIEKYDLFLLDYELIPEEDLIVSSEINLSKPRATEAAMPTSIESVQRRPTSKYALQRGFYIFKMGDNMKDIAAHFKMDVKELYFRNRLPYGVTPLSGERIAVRSYIHFKKTPDYHQSDMILDNGDYLFSETVTLTSR